MVNFNEAAIGLTLGTSFYAAILPVKNSGFAILVGQNNALGAAGANGDTDFDVLIYRGGRIGCVKIAGQFAAKHVRESAFDDRVNG
ncbi:hypothetical protein ACUIJQ_06685 [Levilactobacillus hammesii]|uniref:Uncharacterized protein n=1 Tax=Levilactobacillus hammesii DSM 16381 TaxID=1423753 RepID=A0A0R1URI9_9LACO|nr:hypothetical protein [Levilactobacillus hammesii]KRL95767.1 hypothetical protein FD28_GL001993 [Levilactobacillus hammesii DSM 16381]